LRGCLFVELKEQERKMSDAHKLIEVVLEGFRDVHTGLNKDIENLIESGICDENDLLDTKATLRKMYKLNSDMQDFFVAVLSDDYDSKTTKNDLLNLRLLNTLKREDDRSRRSMVEWFVKERLEPKTLNN
jgi:hypothetical protein